MRQSRNQKEEKTESGNGVKWRRLPGVVTHTFTHFPLELTVYTAGLPKSTRAPKGARWTKVAEISGEAFPNVMRKVIAHALEP